MDVEDERARRVRHVGDVRASSGEVPDEPRVDGAEAELASFGALLRAGHAIEDPADLCGGEVRVDDESRPLANERLEAARTQLIADRRAGAALPHDRAVDRATCNALPHDGRLALVGDADRRNVAGIRLRRGKRIARDGDRRGEDLVGVVLDVSRGGVVLGDLAVGTAAHRATLVEDERGRPGRALIQREDVSHAVLKRRIGSISRR